MGKRTEIRAERSDYQRYVGLAIFKIGDRDERLVAKELEFAEVDDGKYIEPSIKLRTDEAQLLMDELWRCGLRPTEGSGSAGSLAATERHLRDMQGITKGLLKKQGVET